MAAFSFKKNGTVDFYLTFNSSLAKNVVRHISVEEKHNPLYEY